MNTWQEKIEERMFHDKHLGKWIITGWYEEEVIAFKAAQAAWEKKQYEGWEKNPQPAMTEDSFTLDIVDDCFSWNVITPWWFQHSDGTWHKMLCHDTSLPDWESGMPGEFPSLAAAEATVKNFPEKAPAFSTMFPGIPYQEHLDSAEPPISTRENP